ncbi:MAG: hypothetical protein J7497_17530, partial [Chitinophagaceae bacterium]|nr:hypothetical protein [Chitinophagaceae bacterium]
MAEQFDKIAQLLARRLYAQLTEEELATLETWAKSSSVRERIEKDWVSPQAVMEELQGWSHNDNTAIVHRLEEKLGISFGKQPQATRMPGAHRIHFLKTTWFRYAAAIIIIAGIGAYLWNTQQKVKPLITSTKPVPVKNDVLPGTQKAILTLSDGKKIELNNAASETIHDQTLSIENNNGQLIYKKGELV